MLMQQNLQFPIEKEKIFSLCSLSPFRLSPVLLAHTFSLHVHNIFLSSGAPRLAGPAAPRAEACNWSCVSSPRVSTCPITSWKSQPAEGPKGGNSFRGQFRFLSLSAALTEVVQRRLNLPNLCQQWIKSRERCLKLTSNYIVHVSHFPNWKGHSVRAEHLNRIISLVQFSDMQSSLPEWLHLSLSRSPFVFLFLSLFLSVRFRPPLLP